MPVKGFAQPWSQTQADGDARHTSATTPRMGLQPTAVSAPSGLQQWNANVVRSQGCNAHRLKLKRRVFRGCDKDGDGYLDKDEMLSLAVLTGFDGPDESWAVEYARLCRECNADRNIGIAQSTLLTLLDDQSEAGFFCTDKQLEEMSAALESDSDS